MTHSGPIKQWLWEQFISFQGSVTSRGISYEVLCLFCFVLRPPKSCHLGVFVCCSHSHRFKTHSVLVNFGRLLLCKDLNLKRITTDEQRSSKTHGYFTKLTFWTTDSHPFLFFFLARRSLCFESKTCFVSEPWLCRNKTFLNPSLRLKVHFFVCLFFGVF